MASEVGRLFIALEGALTEAAPDKEAREKLAKYIRKGIRMHTKQAAGRLFVNENDSA